MKEVITRQKYKCDFCKKRGIKTAMEKHERRCFRNPNRFCDNCENKGFTKEQPDPENHPWITQEFPCIYCSKRDPEIEKGIAAYEAQNLPPNKIKV